MLEYCLNCLGWKTTTRELQDSNDHQIEHRPRQQWSVQNRLGEEVVPRSMMTQRLREQMQKSLQSQHLNQVDMVDPLKKNQQFMMPWSDQEARQMQDWKPSMNTGVVHAGGDRIGEEGIRRRRELDRILQEQIEERQRKIGYEELRKVRKDLAKEERLVLNMYSQSPERRGCVTS